MTEKLGNPFEITELINTVNDIVDNKQDTLVSGTNIKTINNESILGRGNITIEVGNDAVWGAITGTLSNQKDLQTALNTKAADNAVVHKTGNETISGTKTFSSTISGSINGNAATVTNGVYTSGDQTISGTKTFNGAVTITTATVTGTLNIPGGKIWIA